MTYSKFLALFLLLSLCQSGFAQNQQIKKADKLYKLNEYPQAISLYEQGLREEENLPAKTKLAYCYLMTNNMKNAERLYSEIVLEDRARPITNFYYGEALMSNGNYKEAKKWFLKYGELNPEDARAFEMAAACDGVGAIQPLFENIEVKAFSKNSKSDDSGAVFFKNGIVFTSDRNSGVNPLKKKAGRTGRDFLRIYFSEADSTGTFHKPQVFSKKLNEINKHCGPLSFNEEQNFVVFTRTGTSADKSGSYNMQLYYSESNNGKKWKRPKALPFCKKENNYMHPTLTADGQTLYFVSDKPGGEGGTDIYKSKRTEKGWSTPLNLGTVVNTPFNEGFPFIAADDKLYFCSKGHSGYGGFDIFVVDQEKVGLWSTLRNVGAPINSPSDDISFHLDPTFTKGMFASSRVGNDDDIYVFEILPSTIVNTDYEAPEDVYARKAMEVAAANKRKLAALEEEKAANERKKEADNIVDLDKNESAIENENHSNSNFNNNSSVREENIVADEQKSETESIVDLNEKEKFVETETHSETNFNNNNATAAEEKIVLSVQKSETEIADLNKTKKRVETEARSEEIVKINSSAGVRFKTEETEIGVAENSETQLDTIVPEEKVVSETKEFVATKTENANDVVLKNDLDERAAEAETATETKAPALEIRDEIKVNRTPATANNAAGSTLAPELFTKRPDPAVFPFVQANYLLKKGGTIKGKTFRMNTMNFPKGEYIITPKMAKSLNSLVDVLERHPELKIEIAASTSSVGDDIENLEMSKDRAAAIAAHLIKQGIASDRITAEGYGENRLLNRCANGVDCSEKEHRANERIELLVF